MTSLWGRPAAEKIGIFCPRAIEFITSMVEMPVWIISSGYMREYGLMGDPSRWVICKATRIVGVKNRTVNIQIVLREYLRTLINGIPRPVEYSSKHVFSDWKFHAAAGEFDVR